MNLRLCIETLVNVFELRLIVTLQVLLEKVEAFINKWMAESDVVEVSIVYSKLITDPSGS